MRDGRSKEDRSLVAEIMHYPKETIIQAFMHTGFYNREQLTMELLLAELKRQHDMYDAETKRFGKIPPDKITKKRWDYHFRKTDAILNSLNDLDQKLDEKLGITKGEENGSVIGGRGGVRSGRCNDDGPGGLASEEAAVGGGG